MKAFNSKNDEFYKCHPVVNLVYFLSVIGLTMFFWHPVFLLISLIASIVYLKLYKVKTYFKYMVLMMLFIVLFNLLVNHQGTEILFYMLWGNPITLESLIYGVSGAFMIVGVMMWFLCYMQIVTSDKFIYLFSKLSKKMSLFFSMILRFVPLLVGRLKEVYSIQSLMYDNKISKVKLAVNSFFVTTTWAIENAITTSDSMKSRGYELKGRTCYSNYKLDKRDILVLAVIILLLAVTIIMIKNQDFYISFFPSIKITVSCIGVISSSVLLFLPELINLYYKLKWLDLI